ncbi:SPRY domain-containing SOCS box protein 3-like isoform X2 [Boleophthalmus pectinirostris]|uniref:SPRY domain-containing SOCS box protein 3-like isoform X2 n=1 Tax=Boleophthalmus pectinirostris TaxID=150288 RepID=UPI00242CDF26|nr:SPRY domain-containing SOCS box protein 3-like isoform X2 [Boleophthalmus pectinirostris]
MSHCKTASKKTTARAAMLRRARNSRVRLAWAETQREADTMALIHTWDRAEEEPQEGTQIGELPTQVGHLEPVPEVLALPSTVPVTGESFCQCQQHDETTLGAILNGFNLISDCRCGEEDQDFDWVWDDKCNATGAFLSCENRKVTFHSDYSCGTAAIRGNKELTVGQYFWEVKMTSPVYGTDMMVGIGTLEVNLEKFKYSFGSFLGHDEDSWGLSYTGLFQHKGDKVRFSSRFGQGSIIGVHLDTWHGTLTFYKNRHCIGVAATKLPNKKFYPMACSTAAKSSMKVIRACYTPTSLQYLCCVQLRHMSPHCPDVLSTLDVPPGLRSLLRAQMGWVFSLNNSTHNNDTSEPSLELSHVYYEDMSLPSSTSISPIPSPVPSLSACASLSPCPSLFDPVLYQCPCQTVHTHSCTCLCPPTPPSSDYDSCCSEPEDYRSKRCRWT